MMEKQLAEQKAFLYGTDKLALFCGLLTSINSVALWLHLNRTHGRTVAFNIAPKTKDAYHE